MTKKIRVRFAPSPTGPLHIGGVRTALYNYLFAKKHGGTFILRIEDTDQKRYVANAENYIIESLKWAGIPYDEGIGKESKYGPYRQSERKEIYKKYVQELIDNGWAYYAFDSANELDKYRKESESKGETFIYNWHNRLKLNNSLVLSNDEVKERIVNEKYVIRFKVPQDELLQTTDIIRGTMKIDTNTLDDKILFKSDGMPTYHLANIIDDHLMEISHVIRGEEWLPSLALHVLLYRAFNWETPEFAHLPLLLKPVGKGKLSKRDGDKFGFPVFPLAYTNEQTGEISRGYREDGYFPEAFINMLAFLGWNPGTEQEIFTLKELIQAFTLKKVSKSGAKFNLDKTKWFQQQWMQQTNNSVLAKKLNIIVKEKTGKEVDLTYSEKVVTLIKERAIFINDLWNLGNYFYKTPDNYDTKAAKKAWKEGAGEIMQGLVTIIENVSPFTSESIETAIKKWIEEQELGFGKVLMPLRLSLVGSMQGPHVFDIASMIGREESIHRIQKAIKELS